MGKNSLTLTVCLLSSWLPLEAATVDEPALPAGLEKLANTAPAPTSDRQGDAANVHWEIPSGFAEIRLGSKLDRKSSASRKRSLTEFRLRGDFEAYSDRASATLKADLVYDDLAQDRAIDLDEGSGWLQLREALLSFSASDSVQLDAGRKVLTWGTGDLLFVNDLFPKDYNAFFLGRGQQYLKAPSDMARLTVSSESAVMELVYVPSFNANYAIDPDRLTLPGPATSSPPQVKEPHGDEWHLRVARRIGSWETALYGFHGFTKDPVVKKTSGLLTYPRLSVWGASVRGPLAGGIVNAELGYYDYDDNSPGRDMNPLDQYRVLLGLERKLGNDLTLGTQFYQEHDTGLIPPTRDNNDDYRLLTGRVTKLLMNQNLRLSLFVFHSPTDDDSYWRGMASFKLNDDYHFEFGANLFAGDNDHGAFSRLEDNSNLFFSLKSIF